MNKKLQTLAFLSTSGIFSALMFYIYSFVGAFITVNILALLLYKPDEGLGGLAVGFLSLIAGLIFSLISLYPSYKIMMRLAIYLREKRGWEIRHPRKLFLASLLLVAAVLFVLLAR